MRLMGAMLHACTQHGYGAITIPELSRLASVSLREIIDGVSAILEHCARHPLECEPLLRREIGGPRSALDLADGAYADFVVLFVPSVVTAPSGVAPILPEAVAGGLLHIAEEQVALTGPAGLLAIAEQIIYLLQTSVFGLAARHAAGAA